MSKQTNVHIVPFRFPLIRRGKLINKRYDGKKEVPNASKKESRKPSPDTR